MLTLNVKDTKKQYVQVHHMALNGLEVITETEQGEVSHINKAYLDYLFENGIQLQSHIIRDEEIGGFTVICETIELYGEGETIDEAIEDLIDTSFDYFSLFQEDPVLYSKMNTMEKNIAILKLLRCVSDEEIRTVMGLDGLINKE